ncbi:MAG: hypothetical protein ACW99U_20515 [Candidatus Thorarchaeota archaeon]|jgi:hypothetical protein
MPQQFTIVYDLTDYQVEMLERARAKFNEGQVHDAEEVKKDIAGMLKWCLKEQIAMFINGEENAGASALGVEFGMCTPEQQEQLRAMFLDGKGKEQVD